MKILLVGEGDRVKRACRRFLAGREYELLAARDPQQALDILSQNRIDIVLLDLNRSTTDGEELLGAIHKKYRWVPIIIATGKISADAAYEYMNQGAYDFITEPYDRNRFLISIKRAEEKRKSERRARRLEKEVLPALLELNTEKKRLRTIINCMGNGVMVTDQALEIILHNPAFMRLLELSEELKNPFPIGKVISDGPLIETLSQILRGGVKENEFVSQEIQMGKHTLRAISTPAFGLYRNVFLKVSGTVTVFEDITAFSQLDQMKSHFVNMVAHELRSPLVSIRQLNSVLAEGLAGPLNEKQKDLVHRVLKRIDALLGLINDLLDVAKIEAGKHVQSHVTLDIGQIVEEIVALMEPRAKEHGIALSYSCQNLKPIQADPKGMEEVLNNLISNAINYSPDGGEVTVTAQGLGGYLEIKVRDTGVGIPPEELPKIFDKFYRVKHPKTRNVTGTGLGLSIVKGVVESHHGSIDVESVLDKGTTFRILLPIAV